MSNNIRVILSILVLLAIVVLLLMDLGLNIERACLNWRRQGALGLLVRCFFDFAGLCLLAFALIKGVSDRRKRAKGEK